MTMLCYRRIAVAALGGKCSHEYLKSLRLRAWSLPRCRPDWKSRMRPPAACTGGKDFEPLNHSIHYVKKLAQSAV